MVPIMSTTSTSGEGFLHLLKCHSMGRAGAADIAQLVERKKGMQEASSLIPNPNPVPPKSGHIACAI